MRKLYFSFLPALIVSACATRVAYVGSSYTPTQQVEVFVTQQAVKKPFDIIGKGYVHTPPSFSNEEKIQRKAVEKAKQKGADAVIIEDYFVLATDNSVTTSVVSDSSRKVSVGVGTAQAHPSVTSGFQILFIRYKP